MFERIHIHIFHKTTWEVLGGQPFSEYIKPSNEQMKVKICKCGLIKTY